MSTRVPHPLRSTCPKASRAVVPSISRPIRAQSPRERVGHSSYMGLLASSCMVKQMINTIKLQANALEMLPHACTSIWISLNNITFLVALIITCITFIITPTLGNNSGAFQEVNLQMVCRCLHGIIGIFANHRLYSRIILSLKGVMVVLFITRIEMKGDLKECTAVGSKSHDLVAESSDASGWGRQTSVC